MHMETGVLKRGNDETWILMLKPRQSSAFRYHKVTGS